MRTSRNFNGKVNRKKVISRTSLDWLFAFKKIDMGILVYDCYNEYSEDNVMFYASKEKESLVIKPSIGCNPQIIQDYSITIDREDVIGLIDYLQKSLEL